MSVLILGTPDYSTVGWRVIEPLYGFFAPGGCEDADAITRNHVWTSREGRRLRRRRSSVGRRWRQSLAHFAGLSAPA